MTTLIHRRSLLRGLFAAPAIVAVGNIMPVRSIERFANQGIIASHDGLVWSISGPDAALFRCDPLTGELTWWKDAQTFISDRDLELTIHHSDGHHRNVAITVLPK